MRWLAELLAELKARRAGRRGTPKGLGRAAFHLGGPTGVMTSAGWSRVAESHEAYIESLDRRLPPSLHISERDRLRAGDAIPLAERCIEDWNVSADDRDAADEWPEIRPDSSRADNGRPDSSIDWSNFR